MKALLAGELVDHSELGYDLDAHHLALLAKGEGAEELMRAAAGTLDRRLLAVQREEEPIPACWLGGRGPLAAAEAETALLAAAAVTEADLHHRGSGIGAGGGERGCRRRRHPPGTLHRRPLCRR